jgi:uncharacterized protein (TIGR03435 family)
MKWPFTILVVAVLGAAQDRPTFEVASVKEIAPGETRYVQGEKLTGSTFFDRTTLLNLIVRAYLDAGGAGICANRVAFGDDCPLIAGSLPGWVKTERYEVQAKLPAGSVTVQPNTGPTSPGSTSSPRRSLAPMQFRLMLQVLLEDRFGLRVHRETRELQVWALTLGKRPLRLKRAAAPEIRKRADGTPVAIHGLGVLLRTSNPDGTSKGQMTFQASTMQDTADSLTVHLDRPVVDRTGLDGEYDFTIEYESEPTVRPPGGLPFLSAGLTAARLSAAIEDLGLKLESAKAAFPVLVIDRVEKPTPDRN